MHAWGRVALLLGLTGISGAACAAPVAPTASTPLDVSYRQVGVSDGVVVLVERRPERGREYLVLCDPARNPPCVRVPAETMRGDELASWQRTRATVTPISGPIPSAAPASPGAAPASPGAAPRPEACEGGRCGQLRLVAHPWCELERDGSRVGRTPILDQWLPEGMYEARCHNPETGQVEVFGVRIEAARRTTLNLGIGRLDTRFAPR